jgi:hypothetical protein
MQKVLTTNGCHCPICGVFQLKITQKHLQYKHNGMTTQEFSDKYPQYRMYIYSNNMVYPRKKVVK